MKFIGYRNYHTTKCPRFLGCEWTHPALRVGELIQPFLVYLTKKIMLKIPDIYSVSAVISLNLKFIYLHTWTHICICIKHITLLLSLLCFVLLCLYHQFWIHVMYILLFVRCVSKIKSILSIIFHAIYGAVCIQLTHFSYTDCENTWTLSYYQHQIGSMTYLPLFRVRSWNNSMWGVYVFLHNNDVIMSMMASQITSPTIVYSTVYSGADHKKTSKLCVNGLCEGNSPVIEEMPRTKGQ